MVLHGRGLTSGEPKILGIIEAEYCFNNFADIQTDVGFSQLQAAT